METGKTVRYETYHADHENPYSRPSKMSSEWRCELPVVNEDSQYETDDDYEEVCEERTSGVTDIIITGEVRVPVFTWS
jgi:hypothetical protein